MKNPKLTTASGIPESLTNLFYRDECSVFAIKDAVEDSNTGLELAAKLNRMELLVKGFKIDRETSEYVRLVATSYGGGKHYLIAEK